MNKSPAVLNAAASMRVVIIVIVLLYPMALCYSQPQYDVQGSWGLWFEIQNGYNPYPITITNEDFSTGLFSGTAYQSYPISGSVSGSHIHWSDPEIGGYGGGFDGDITTNGTMSGSMWYNNGHGIWTGFWGETSGVAVQCEVPVFTLQPINVVTNAGRPVTFMAVAAGYPRPTYQWQFNGTNINNATNASYLISETSVTNLGFYDVVSCNAIGTNVSATVSLSFLDMKCFPGLILYGPPGMIYSIQAASATGGESSWTTIMTITLTAQQPYVYVDYGSRTNGNMFYRAVPQ